MKSVFDAHIICSLNAYTCRGKCLRVHVMRTHTYSSTHLTVLVEVQKKCLWLEMLLLFHALIGFVIHSCIQKIWSANIFVQVQSGIISYFFPSFAQILHVIDDILTPLTVNPASTVDLNNPDGYQFLSYSDNLDIGGYRLR